MRYMGMPLPAENSPNTKSILNHSARLGVKNFTTFLSTQHDQESFSGSTIMGQLKSFIEWCQCCPITFFLVSVENFVPLSGNLLLFTTHHQRETKNYKYQK